MSFHDKRRYPHENTDKIRAELALRGMTFRSPSQLSDAFRFGYLAGKDEKSNDELLYQLEQVLELDLSNSKEVKEIIKTLEQSQ